MPAPILFDVTHTSHTRARTGIQRVTRALLAELGGDLLPITHDPHARWWRTLASWENANLSAETPARKRGAQWPLGLRWREGVRRLLGTKRPRVAPALAARAREAGGLLVPEIFSPGVARALPALGDIVVGPRVAIFYDAIALKYPELTPRGTVARFPGYLLELLAFDGIAAISEDSRDALVDYWRWAGVRDAPPVEAIPLGIDLPADSVAPISDFKSPIPTILSVGSIEGRKNHRALLEACEALWERGARFTLHLIGLAQPQTGAAALAKIEALQQAGRPLRYDGPVPDAELARAYAACAFTVYPSIVEGFGLPVLESLARGKPCICSGRGALGESTRDGGCLALESVDAAALATAIERLLSDRGELPRLVAEVRARRFRTWTEYAATLAGWMRTVRRRR